MPRIHHALQLVALTTLLCLAGAAPAPRPQIAPAPSTTANAARYADPTYGLSLAVPTFAPVKERTVIATFQGPARDGFVANVTLMVDPGATTRDAYLEASVKQLSESNPRYTLRRLDKPQVSGKDAVVLEYDFGAANRRLRFLQLAVFADDRVFVLTCTAPVDSYKDFETEFRKVVDSFRLDK